MNKRWVKRLFNYGIIVVLFILIIVFSVFSNNFLKISTIFTILRQVAITGIISIGMSFVIITGGIDLSVGSIAGVSSVIAAMLMLEGISVFTSIIITLLISLLYGLFNGFLITVFKMQPLIATLGTQTSLRGLAFIVTGGLPVFGFSDKFGEFANGSLGVVPYPVILMIVIFILAFFILKKSIFGRYVYGVGGNAEATRLSGISVTKIKLVTYTLSSFLAGVAGLVLLSRTNSGQPSAGVGYEMDAITAVVLGGISLNGGIGSLPLVMIGVLIMGVLSTGMLMVNINDYVQQLIKGLVLIAAVAFSNISQNVDSRLISSSKSDEN
jgi:ribose transport system permease protein